VVYTCRDHSRIRYVWLELRDLELSPEECLVAVPHRAAQTLRGRTSWSALAATPFVGARQKLDTQSRYTGRSREHPAARKGMIKGMIMSFITSQPLSFLATYRQGIGMLPSACDVVALRNWAAPLGCPPLRRVSEADRTFDHGVVRTRGDF
jgi:hypothetical protein